MGKERKKMSIIKQSEKGGEIARKSRKTKREKR
jgi:hypothetical protein